MSVYLLLILLIRDKQFNKITYILTYLLYQPNVTSVKVKSQSHVDHIQCERHHPPWVLATGPDNQSACLQRSWSICFTKCARRDERELWQDNLWLLHRNNVISPSSSWMRTISRVDWSCAVWLLKGVSKETHFSDVEATKTEWAKDHSKTILPAVQRSVAEKDGKAHYTWAGLLWSWNHVNCCFCDASSATHLVCSWQSLFFSPVFRPFLPPHPEICTPFSSFRISITPPSGETLHRCCTWCLRHFLYAQLNFKLWGKLYRQCGNNYCLNPYWWKVKFLYMYKNFQWRQ